MEKKEGKTFIPLSVPNIKGNELKYVTEALLTEWVSTGGAFITRFEKEIANYLETESAVACQSGTAGLHLAMLALDIGSEDEVIVPTLTFIATVNPVAYIGAHPIFMDCDDSLCMDPNKLRLFLEEECYQKDGRTFNLSSNREIKAIIIVHVFGNIADMSNIMKIAKEYNIAVIEDATEALGSYFNSGDFLGRYAGTIGDIGVYSFNGNKIITTGGGGMVVGKNPLLLNKIAHLSTQAKTDDVYYTHDQVGYNYRMTNVQAAIGIAQLERLEEFISIKSNNYQKYNEKLSAIDGLRLLPYRNGVRPNYWFYALFLEDGYKYTRDELIERMKLENIQLRPIWDLIHKQPPYKHAKSYKIEHAPFLLDRIVNIPCSSNLKDEQLERVIEVLKD